LPPFPHGLGKLFRRGFGAPWQCRCAVGSRAEHGVAATTHVVTNPGAGVFTRLSAGVDTHRARRRTHLPANNSEHGHRFAVVYHSCSSHIANCLADAATGFISLFPQGRSTKLEPG